MTQSFKPSIKASKSGRQRSDGFGIIGAHRSGLLAAARSPASPAQLAAATGMAESRVVDICRALDAHEVLIQADGQYQLAAPWLILTAPNSPFLFEDVLAFTFTQMKTLANQPAAMRIIGR